MATTKKVKANVTRVKAADNAPKKPKKAIDTKPSVFARIGGYFKGAWTELRLVRWPNRRATWSLTVAVVLFTLFFVVFILLLDTLFKYIFQIIIT